MLMILLRHDMYLTHSILIFFKALSTFSAALSSGQLAPLMQQFKLSTSATEAASKGGKV